MPARFLFAPSFPSLLRGLVREIEEACRGDPLGPKWVIVPSSTVAFHVRLRLAAAAGKGVLAGVRVVAFPQFAQQLSEGAGEAPARRWSPAHDFLLFDLLRRKGEGQPASWPLAGLTSRAGGHQLLRPTLLDLGDAGFGPDDRELLEELAEEPDLHTLERETLRLYGAWLEALDGASLDWEPLLLQRLVRWVEEVETDRLHVALAGEAGHSPRLFCYGFYDFTDVSAGILCALGRRLDLAFLYPAPQPLHGVMDTEVHPAFGFTQPVLEDLRLRLGSTLEQAVSHLPRQDEVQGVVTHSAAEVSQSLQVASAATAQDQNGLAKQERERALSSQHDEKLAADFTAPSASRPQQPHEEETTQFFLASFPEGRIGGQPEFLSFQKASGVRAEVLSSALRVRTWLDDPLRPLRLEEILVVAPEAEPYLEALREAFSSFAIPLRAVDAPLGPTPRERALHILARLALDGAPAEWLLAYLRGNPGLAVLEGVQLDAFEEKLRALKIWGGQAWRRLAALLEPGPREEELPAGFTPAEKRLVEEVVRLWVEGGLPERSFRPAEAAALLEEMQSRWMGEPEALDPVIEQLERLPADLVLPGQVLLHGLQGLEPAPHSDAADRPAVVFAPLMRARGLTARGLVVLGLASGRIPFRIEEDPLLSDSSRLRLAAKARMVGHRLPLKGLAGEEMMLLFFLLNTSAERIHWVIPESDEDGRSVAPTPWVQRYLKRWEADKTTRENWTRRRIPRGPAQQADLLQKLDVPRGSFLPPELAAYVQPELIAGDGSRPDTPSWESRQQRRLDPNWNGRVPSAAFSPGRGESRTVRVTELEDLARCPFRFFSRVAARLKKLEALEFAEEVDHLTRGRLAHQLLEELFLPYVEAGRSLAEAASELLQDEGAALRRSVEALRDTDFTLELMPPLLAKVVRDQLFEAARRYLETLIGGGDRRPISLEVRVQGPYLGQEGLQISGRIDRVDRDGSGFRVVDYKTGSPPASGKLLEREISLGYRLQPTLYPWLSLCSGVVSAEPVFSFVHLKTDPPTEDDAGGAVLEQLLTALRPSLEHGHYLPVSTEALEHLGIRKVEPCRYCSFPSLCRRFERGAGWRFARLIETLSPERLDYIRRKGGSA